MTNDRKVSQSYSEYLILLVWCCWENENDGYFIKGGGSDFQSFTLAGQGILSETKEEIQ